MKLRLIGDVHDKINRYFDLLKDTDYSIQLGDFTLDRNSLSKLDLVDCRFHRILFGNHDLWCCKNDYPHIIHKAGSYTLGNFEFFAIPGAYSIDRAWRTYGVDWFDEEEIRYADGLECIDEFNRTKPQYVLSHDAPEEAFFRVVPNPISSVHSITRNIMSDCFVNHKPWRWFFGHHHKSIKFKIENTIFRCLNELEFCDLEI